MTEIARARICQEFPGTITSCELRRPAPDSVRSGNVQLGEGRPFETEVCEYWARIGHGSRLINFLNPTRGPMKSCLTRHFDTSRGMIKKFT